MTDHAYTIPLNPLSRVRPGARAGTMILPHGNGEITVQVGIDTTRADPNVLLKRLGAEQGAAVRRPQVEQLPPALGDGVSVLRFDATPDGALVASLAVLRRMPHGDVVLRARTGELSLLFDLYDNLLGLLTNVVPVAGSDERRIA